MKLSHPKLPSMKLADLPFFRHFTVISLLSVLVLNISVLEFGFDNSLFSLMQAMDSFDQDFDMYHGHSKHKLNPVKLSFLGSLGTPFRAVFMLVALVIGERYGRWIVFVLMQLGSMLGVVVMLTGHTFLQILCGRIVLTIFAGWHDWLIPMYLAEMVPGPVRGAVIASYMGFNYFGSFFASVAAFACSRVYDDSREYRIPMGLMLVAPLLCLSLCWVMPESPRWLVRKGKMDKAVNALYRLNGSKPGYSPEEEARLLKESIDADAKTKGKWMDIFHGDNRRRTLTTLVLIIVVHMTGGAFVTKYGTIFVKGLNAMDPMEFGILERGLGILGPIILTFTVDRYGRRPMFFTCAVLYTICLCLIGGIGTMPVEQIRDVIIPLYILAAILHIISFHGVCMIVSAEIPHLRLRDKTLTVSYVTSFVAEFGVSFSLPYLLYAPYADLESKVGFIYGGIALLGIVFCFFYMPETTGRSLEEMEELWAEKVPPRQFKSYVSHKGIGLRVSQLERHAGAGDMESSQEDLKIENEKDDEKGPTVVYEEVAHPKKDFQ